jgi:hypothetical protein
MVGSAGNSGETVRRPSTGSILPVAPEVKAEIGDKTFCTPHPEELLLDQAKFLLCFGGGGGFVRGSKAQEFLHAESG